MRGHSSKTKGREKVFLQEVGFRRSYFKRRPVQGLLLWGGGGKERRPQGVGGEKSRSENAIIESTVTGREDETRTAVAGGEGEKDKGIRQSKMGVSRSRRS